ncbi:MAG: hypothetical protein H6709_13905 [Kofleriaceae bacterium]|nr:hypothetical protein [Kofleriaceae bacterium]
MRSPRPALVAALPLLMSLGRAAPAAAGDGAAAATADAALGAATVDVDGDGRADDVVRLELPGRVVVQIDGKGGGVAWQGLQTLATPTGGDIAVGDDGGAGRLLIVTARFGAGVADEAVVLRWDRRGKLALVWQGAAGRVGRDGDYQVRIAVEDGALYRYQQRGGVDRCDGRPARLFAEAWNGRAFQAIRAWPDVDDAAPALTATRAAPDAAPTTSISYRAAVASSQAGAGDAAQLGRPTELDDGDPATAWREDRAGDGRGEFFTFRGRRDGARLAGLRIVPGDGRSAAQARATNRVARLAVVTRDHAFWVDVPDDTSSDAAVATPWWVVFPEPIDADCVTVVLAGFPAGMGARAGAGQSAIAELVVLGADDLGGGDDALVADVVAGGLRADSATKLLARRGPAAARAVEAALGGERGAAARVRLLRALAAIGDGGSAATLGAALAAGRDLDDDAVAAIADGLGRAAPLASPSWRGSPPPPTPTRGPDRRGRAAA